MKLIRANIQIQMFIFFNQREIGKYFCFKQKSESHFSGQKDFLFCFQFSSNLLANFCVSLFKWSAVVGDVMPPEIPFVFNFLLANLTLKLLSNCVHV